MKALLTAAALSLCALPAAAAVTFDFRDGSLGGNGRYDVLSGTVDGLGVDVTAGLYAFTSPTTATLDIDCSGAACAAERVVHKRNRANRGLGVDDPVRGGDRGVIDGRRDRRGGPDLNDLLTLTFDRMVSFSSVLFTQASRNDEVDIFIDGALVRENGETSGGPFDLSGLSGMSISFGADQNNDNFRVGAITVTAIPLPAAGLVLLTALGAAAASYRRRKTA